MDCQLTPDGARYARMALGGREPLPFHLRWLLPWLLGNRVVPWVACAWASAVLLTLGTTVLGWQQGLSPLQAVGAGLLVAGLPSVRFQLRAPVLVDLPGMALAVWAATLASEVDPIRLAAAVALSLLAGCAWEKAPIFAALYVGEPLLLVGLLAPAVRWLARAHADPDPADPNYETLTRPLATGLKWHRGRWRDARVMLAPWGACSLALLDPSPWLAAPLAAGYAQLLLATDTVRLYQNAAPAVAIVAVAVVPEALLVAVIALHWLNPWAGDGI